MLAHGWRGSVIGVSRRARCDRRVAPRSVRRHRSRRDLAFGIGAAVVAEMEQHGRDWRAQVEVPANCGPFGFPLALVGRRGRSPWHWSTPHARGTRQLTLRVGMTAAAFARTRSSAPVRGAGRPRNERTSLRARTPRLVSLDGADCWKVTRLVTSGTFRSAEMASDPGAPPGIRTLNQWIKSPLLCR